MSAAGHPPRGLTQVDSPGAGGARRHEGHRPGSGQKLNAKRATFKEAWGGRGGNESGEVR